MVRLDLIRAAFAAFDAVGIDGALREVAFIGRFADLVPKHLIKRLADDLAFGFGVGHAAKGG